MFFSVWYVKPSCPEIVISQFPVPLKGLSSCRAFHMPWSSISRPGLLIPGKMPELCSRSGSDSSDLLSGYAIPSIQKDVNGFPV